MTAKILRAEVTVFRDCRKNESEVLTKPYSVEMIMRLKRSCELQGLFCIKAGSHEQFSRIQFQEANKLASFIFCPNLWILGLECHL